MMNHSSVHALNGLSVRKLEDVPPSGFDCGRESQTRFLYDYAWHDQRQRVSTTYLYHVAELLAAYATVCMDAIPLGRRERPSAIRYQEIAALKLAQLGVDRLFQGRGYGSFAVASVIALAIELSQRAGCRYVTLDAKPNLVEWYQSLGFEINQLKQKQRIAAAADRNPDEIPVSMRFDLREV
ncbi:MAG TPA: GNAT family N-acetyltransferase [Longimicrobium sp.]